MWCGGGGVTLLIPGAFKKVRSSPCDAKAMSEPDQHLLMVLCKHPGCSFPSSSPTKKWVQTFFSLLFRTSRDTKPSKMICLNTSGINQWTRDCIWSNNQRRHIQSCHCVTGSCHAHTCMKHTPAHSHARSQFLSDVRAIGGNGGEARSWCWLLMATASRGAEKGVCNDNVPPSRAALKSSCRPLFMLNASRRWNERAFLLHHVTLSYYSNPVLSLLQERGSFLLKLHYWLSLWQ